MMKFELKEPAIFTAEEKKMIEEARRLPVVYDEDSPELTDEMEKALRVVRKVKPYRIP